MRPTEQKSFFFLRITGYEMNQMSQRRKHAFRYRRFPARVHLAAESQQGSTLERPRAPAARRPDRAAIRGRSSSMARRIFTHVSTVNHADYFAARQMQRHRAALVR